MQQSVYMKTSEVPHLVRTGLWLAVVAGGLWFLLRIQVTLTIFGLAWLIAYLTRPLVALFEGRRLGFIARCPRSLAVGLVYFLLFILFFGVGSMAFPVLSGQFERLLTLQNTLARPQDLADLIAGQEERLSKLVPLRYRAQALERLSTSVDNLASFIGQGLADGLGFVATFFKQVVAGTAIFLSSLLISLYLLFSWESMYQSMISSFPQRYRSSLIELMSKMNQIFGGYLRATVIASGANSLAILIGLYLFTLFSGINCPYTYVIALVGGLTYPIPLFGILSSVLCATLLGFIPETNIVNGLWVGLVVAVVSISIDRLLTPKLMGDAIGVSPIFVIFAAAAGGEFLGGVWGMLLGIPLAAMVKAIFTWLHSQFLVDTVIRDGVSVPAPSLEVEPDMKTKATESIDKEINPQV